MTRNRRLLWGGGLLLAAAGVRAFHIQSASLWFDEAFSVIAARASVPELWQGAADPVLPPFYFLVLHWWQSLTGESELAVRWLSGLASLVAVPCAWRLGTRVFDGRTGSVLAVLMALAPFQIYYAQEARPYALCVGLGAALGVAAVEATARGGWRRWAAYAAISAATLYTHYFFAFVIAALHLYFVFKSPRRLDWIAADAVIGAAFVPQIGMALARVQTVTNSFWIDRPSILSAMKTFDFLWFAATTPTWLVPAALFGVLGVGAVLALDLRRVLQSRPAWRAGVALCLCWLGLPLAIAFAVSQFGSSVYLDRSFALTTPAYYALFALGWRAAPARSPARWLMGGLIGVVIVSLGAFYILPNSTKPDFRTALAEVREQILPGDYMLNMHDSTYFSIHYYLPPEFARERMFILETDHPWLLPSAWPRFGVHVPETWVESLPPGARLWVAIEPRLFDLRQNHLLQALSRKWRTVRHVERLGIELYLFLRS